MKLSKNLSLEEVTKSATAVRHNLSNHPIAEHLENLKILARELFQPIRDHFKKPIYISSGYRSKYLNKILKGAKNSSHMQGKAIDIDQDGRNKPTNREVFDYIENNCNFTLLINEFPDDHGNPSWVHVSYDENDLRKEILVSYKDGRKIKYRKWKDHS